MLFRMKSDIVPLLLASSEGKLKNHKIEWEDKFSLCLVMASRGYPGSYKKGIEIISCNDRLIICITIGLIAGFTSFLVQIMVMPPNIVAPSFLFFWTIAGVTEGISYLCQRIDYL